ncbi:radical SAM protein, partial [archaeon]|nr:radical SAM protein [archaeon]
EKTLKVAESAQNIGVNTRIVSNGYFLTDSLAKRLYEIDLDVVQISLDSHQPTFHDKFRGRVDAFDRAVNAIRYCKEAGLTTNVRYSIMQGNKEDVLPCYELANELEANSFIVKQTYPFGRGQSDDSLLIDRESLLEIQVNLIRESFKKKTKVGFLQPFLVNMETIPKGANILVYPCRCGTSVLFIDSSGDIFPCNYIQHHQQNFKLGNILDPDFDFFEIWYDSEKLSPFREKDVNKRGCCVAFKQILGDKYSEYFVVGDYYE